MRRSIVLGLAFLVTLGLVVGAAAATSLLDDNGMDDPPEIENDHYTDEDLVADAEPGEADVSMEADAESQTIVVDPGLDPASQRGGLPPLFGGLIGPDTTERDVLPLVNVLVENGHDVQIYSPGGDQERPTGLSSPGSEGDGLSPIGEELADADAFVTFRTDYSDDGLDDIETFAEEDGRVLVATDPGDTFERPDGAGLKATLGVTTEPGYVFNLEENDLNYQRIFAEPAGSSELTDGVDRAVFATAGPVGGTATADSELVPIDGSQLSTSRAGTDAPVLVRDGNVAMVGDTNFLAPENVRRADNDVLVGNLADFLVTNDRTPENQPPQPSEPEQGAPGPSPPGGPQVPGQNGTEPPRPTPAGG